MRHGLDDQDGGGSAPERVERRILDDDRRRSGEFLRDFLSRHRVDGAGTTSPATEVEDSAG